MQTAIILANDHFDTPNAKTAHGLVRGTTRYRIVGVVDASCAGRDAGDVLDGRSRDIPIYESVTAAIDGAGAPVEACIVGVATHGGVLPPPIHASLVEAAEASLTLVNGLHQFLCDDPELFEIARHSGAEIIDIRKPRPSSELRFWSGEVLDLPVPRVAVLGTDCALGKRTTCWLLMHACRQRNLNAEMVYTGQTGWLQGIRHGFILDTTINDFVPGELEGAILDCARDTSPDVILLEGQASLRNPSGPCGAELIISAGARGVILQHAPGRKYFEGLDDLGLEIPPIEEEVELVRLLGGEVWGVAINSEGLDEAGAEAARARIAASLNVPVSLPIRDNAAPLAEEIAQRLEKGGLAPSR